MSLNPTHDPSLTSWVASANQPGTDFPIQNLPFAVLRRKGSSDDYRPAVAIGDVALDLVALKETGLTSDRFNVFVPGRLNAFMAQGRDAWSAVRAELSELLSAQHGQTDELAACLIPLSDVEYDLPADIVDYTDFYTSIHHATNIGRLFRPDN
ncbi:MAG: hypothetical protein JJ977_18645, partial [Kordiimonadaceae bacterium]|nr:hypothetical protein [Kordiimonadaceae bacterium]